MLKRGQTSDFKHTLHTSLLRGMVTNLHSKGYHYDTLFFVFKQLLFTLNVNPDFSEFAGAAVFKMYLKRLWLFWFKVFLLVAVNKFHKFFTIHNKPFSTRDKLTFTYIIKRILTKYCYSFTKLLQT